MVGFIFGFIPGWKVFSTLLGLTLFVLLAVIVYENVFAGPNELTSAEVRVIEGMMPQVASEVQQFAEGQQPQLRSVVVMRFQGDTPSGQVTTLVRDRLARALRDKGVNVHGTDLTTRLRDGVFGSGEEDEESLDREEHIAAARERVRTHVAEQRLVDFVLYGTVDMHKLGEHAEVDLDLHLQGEEDDMHRQLTLSLTTYDEVPASAGGGIELGGVGEFLWRLLVFMIVGFFLPVIVGPLAMYAFRMESNAINFLLVATLTALTGLVAWTLTGFGHGGWAIVAVLIALAAGGFWNYRVLEEWERRA